MKPKQGNKLKKVVAMLLMTLLFSNLSVFAAEIGSELVEPEAGWVRFDDRDANISYSGPWSHGTPQGTYYNVTYSETNNHSSSIQFNFTGTKLRLLGNRGTLYDDNLLVNIDDEINDSFSQYAPTGNDMNRLSYEISNLEDKEHYITITFGNGTNGSYFLIDSIDLAEGNTILPYNTDISTPTPTSSVLTITPEKSTIKVGEEVTAELDIDNIQNIAAEDIRIAYDSEKLQYLGHEELEGIKLIYNDVQNGELRFILASKGESNLITAKTTLLKLKFKGISTGEALADITKGRVSDGIDMEKDLTTEECDQTIITIEGLNDVNNSGEFTLLDLAIDARHLLKDPTLAELSEYNTDVVVNNAIDEEDLLEIGKLMLLNSNYSFNN